MAALSKGVAKEGTKGQEDLGQAIAVGFWVVVVVAGIDREERKAEEKECTGKRSKQQQGGQILVPKLEICQRSRSKVTPCT